MQTQYSCEDLQDKMGVMRIAQFMSLVDASKDRAPCRTLLVLVFT